jgi:hypothetical protein
VLACDLRFVSAATLRAEHGPAVRVVADDRLDDEVEAIAECIADSDHCAIARTKAALRSLADG